MNNGHARQGVAAKAKIPWKRPEADWAFMSDFRREPAFLRGRCLTGPAGLP